jgi:hypothetical protein
MKPKLTQLYGRSVRLLLLLVTSIPLLTRPSAAIAQSVSPSPTTASVPTVTLRAAAGTTITFWAQNGQNADGIAPQAMHVPHLVLMRNGLLSNARERTLILEVRGIDVPPTGAHVALELWTQHGDPNPGSDLDQGILVWRESRSLVSTLQVTRTNVTVTFVHEFTKTIPPGPATTPTPTDYYRYHVTVRETDRTSAARTYRLSQDYAFLLENQWIVELPKVPEASPGAAPDELIVYYCDMFPFQRDPRDPATWLRREEVTEYVGTELVPQIVNAYRTQSKEWRFPWHDAWTSYRPEDPERLSVALTDGRTWFHGWAPARGHSGLSLRVKGGHNAAYETLTDGLLSAIHHELFHNLQRDINLRYGGDGDVDGMQDAWQFFSEGTAVLAASVGQPRGQFTETLPAHTYVSYANRFVLWGGGHLRGLNTNYDEMDPYSAAIYWRFLYEHCGGMENGAEDPAAGMQVIRRALEALYSRQVVDIRSSTDLVGGVPKVMDRALAGSACPFQTYADSMTAFARALYGLRLPRGRCAEPGLPAECGFYDPYHGYHDPPISRLTYNGTDQEYDDGIGSSFGIDLIGVSLDGGAEGQPLALKFYSAPRSHARLNVQLLQLVDSGEDADSRSAAAETRTEELLPRVSSDGHLVYLIPAIHTVTNRQLGLIITRLDANEALDPIGEYTILLRSGR